MANGINISVLADDELEDLTEYALEKLFKDCTCYSLTFYEDFDNFVSDNLYKVPDWISRKRLKELFHDRLYEEWMKLKQERKDEAA